jgi:hypothetical protein
MFGGSNHPQKGDFNWFCVSTGLGGNRGQTEGFLLSLENVNVPSVPEF